VRDLEPHDAFVLLSCAEMAKADALAIAAGIAGQTLMEAAGRAVAEAVMLGHRRRPVAVLCGPGNNGGDGFVAARHLQAAGWPLRLGLLGSRAALKGDAAWAAGAWQGRVEPLSVGLLDGRPLVIDALFGAGLSRPIDGAAAEVIDRMNRDGLAVVAVDVPSGLHGDSGEVLGHAPFAERTVTFFRAKPGHHSVAGLQRCGELSVADIGTPGHVLREIAPRLWLNDPLLWRTLLKREAVDDYKYARGHLTILGGATATGAARMGALAARRAGVGLATIATPRSAMAIYQSGDAGNLVAESDDAAAFAALLKDHRRNAVLIGPGSGINPRTRAAVLDALAAERSVLLDADAITCFADSSPHLFDAIRGPTLLTPHEGEFRRLFPDLSAGQGKVERTRAAARRSGATVLLKGPDTVIAAPDGRAVVNVHASPSLATAGSGDVLAGIAAGLMAQGIGPLAAGAAAAWLHGESALQFNHPGLVAEDLIATLPAALQAAIGVD
jgi:NAD(P)H-hydrate epimerase